jgi:hypothetical protein
MIGHLCHCQGRILWFFFLVVHVLVTILGLIYGCVKLKKCGGSAFDVHEVVVPMAVRLCLLTKQQKKLCMGGILFLFVYLSTFIAHYPRVSSKRFKRYAEIRVKRDCRSLAFKVKMKISCLSGPENHVRS